MKIEGKEMIKKILLSAVLTVAIVVGYNQYDAHKEAQERKEIERILQSFNMQYKSPLELMKKQYDDRTCFERQAKVAKERQKQELQKYILEYALQYTNEKDAVEYATSIMREAYKRGYDPLLITAIVRQESVFDKTEVGSSIDTGAMQLLPGTAKAVAKSLGEKYDYENLFNIATNIRYGTKFYDEMVSVSRSSSTLRTHNAEYTGLISYNRGPGRTIKEYKKGRPVTEYADSVMKIYKELKTNFENRT